MNNDNELRDNSVSSIEEIVEIDSESSHSDGDGYETEIDTSIGKRTNSCDLTQSNVLENRLRSDSSANIVLFVHLWQLKNQIHMNRLLTPKTVANGKKRCAKNISRLWKMEHGSW